MKTFLARMGALSISGALACFLSLSFIACGQPADSGGNAQGGSAQGGGEQGGDVQGGAGQAGVTSIRMGEASILSTSDSGNGNLLAAQAATLSQTATIRSLSLYVSQAAGSLRLGVYDATGPNGGPGALKAQTISFTPTTGWNTKNVTAPSSLKPGTYWLAYLPSSKQLGFALATTGSAVSYPYSYGPMPETFSTSVSRGAYHWSFYATLSRSGRSTPDTTPPTALSNLAANATSQSSIAVSWSASTDDVGVSGYDVERCQGVSCAKFVNVGSPRGTSFYDSGLAADTAYSYRVRATDKSGKTSGWSGVVTATTSAGGATETGLDFPGSAAVSTTMRFQFPNPQLNGLPIWGPHGRGATYMWRAYPRQQPGYYTTFFWGTTGDFWWGGFTFYGFHPYPQGGGVHKWEIACDKGLDVLGGVVAYDRWFTQVARVWADANGKHMEFYWDWPDQSRVITHTAAASYGNTDPPSPALTWGDAPWPSSTGSYGPSGQGNEVYDGIVRGIQIYNNKLSLSDIQSEIDSPLSSAAGASSIWYLNLNPTPSDISDKSGRGHNPRWVGTERPSLYTR